MNGFSGTIGFRCRDACRYSRIVCDALVECGFDAGLRTEGDNVAYVFMSCQGREGAPEQECPDIIVCDESCVDPNTAEMSGVVVTDYANAQVWQGVCGNVFTFSEDQYGADLTCRNVSAQDGLPVFDILSAGILSRVRVKRNDVSVRDVLLCSAVLINAGIPIASIVGCFGRRKEEKEPGASGGKT